MTDIIDQKGYLFSSIFFLFSLFLFYQDSQDFWNSLVASLLAAGLFWLSYIFFRLIYLTFKR